jgi:hypothetical protein
MFSRLRRVSNSQDYRIVNTSFSILGLDLMAPELNTTRLNAALGYICLMTIHLASYLVLQTFSYNQDIILPFTLHFSSDTLHLPHAVSAHEVGNILLSETGITSFILGLSMLNYNIAYLCHTQGVQVSPQECIGTLEMLARLCQSSNLGREGGGLSVFPLEFSQVYDLVSEVLKGETRDIERILNMVKIRGTNELELSWDVL